MLQSSSENDCAIQEFKLFLADRCPPETIEGVLGDDALLHRFLAARQYDLEKAAAMLMAMLEWKKRENVDDIVENFTFSEAQQVNEIYPRYFHKHCKLGRAVLINKLSYLNMPQLLNCTTPERFLKEHIREIEKITKYRMPACAKKHPQHKEAGQLFNIVDIKGVALSGFPQVQSIVTSIAKTDTEYYPETLGCMCIINAPMLFTAIWAIIKRFLDQKTISKIHILGANYQDKLLDLIDASNLPLEYGGTCACPGGCAHSDVGPWNDGSVPGFPIAFWEDFKTRDGVASRVPDYKDPLYQVDIEDSSTMYIPPGMIV
ncbi:cytosolic factor, phosphatidylinositol/phosphatidylcholine transfer protein [Kappamyces sp. JEL0829]|nr:cytosolic factor, phosphatidylinositol/phosphatidylcholine transfer protein [Kappamyces sp. JEL0829]